MISWRRSLVIRPQVAISSRVRPQPVQMAWQAAKAQRLTQGLKGFSVGFIVESRFVEGRG